MSYLSGTFALPPGPSIFTAYKPTNVTIPKPVTAIPLPVTNFPVLKPVIGTIAKAPVGPQTSSGTGTAYPTPAPQQPTISLLSTGSIGGTSVSIPKNALEVGDVSDLSESKFPWVLILIAAGVFLVSQRKRGR